MGRLAGATSTEPARGLSGAPGPESDLWQGSPSAKALFGTLIGAGVVCLLIPFVAWAFYHPSLLLIGGLNKSLRAAIERNEGTIGLVTAIAIGVLVGARLLRLIWQVAVLKSHRYRITNQRITIETGVFSKKIEEIDMRTVTDFQLEQSFLERVLRIGDITLVSSDPTTARLTLIGLPDPRDMRELIRSSAYQATRGQLFTRET
jgi:membrane protein YdbS with pleckstrin-like domain